MLPIVLLLIVAAIAMAFLGARALALMAMQQRSERAAAILEGRVLVPGLSNEVLRGGDTPSPYCRTDGGYELCGWPP